MEGTGLATGKAFRAEEGMKRGQFGLVVYIHEDFLIPVWCLFRCAFLLFDLCQFWLIIIRDWAVISLAADGSLWTLSVHAVTSLAELFLRCIQLGQMLVDALSQRGRC